MSTHGSARPPLVADLAIIGAGPTGLFSAYYAGFRGLSTIVVDSLSEVGGQITAMYPEKVIYDVAGCPAIRGRDLVNALVKQAAEYDPMYQLGTRVQDIVDVANGVRLVTDGPPIEAKAVVICAGTGDFTPRELPAAKGFAGTGVAYFVTRLEEYRDRSVVIVGGGDSAVDWALALEPIASKVRLVHRRTAFRAHAASVRRLHASSVEILTPYQVTALHGTDRVDAVTIRDEQDGSEAWVECDAVIAALGFIADVSTMKTWGIRLNGHKIAVDERMNAGRDRVFAAGDITDSPGKVRLIAVGFGEAATAVNHIAQFLDPEAPLFPGHSTDPK